MCEDCIKKIIINNRFICPICGHLCFLGNVCFECKKRSALDGAWLASDYKNELLKKSIKAFKYGLVKELRRPLGEILKKYLDNIANNYAAKFDFDVIVPVPLHRRKFLYRGFNQAELLANEVAEKYSLAVNTTVLKRRRFTKSQMKLKEKKRFKNVVGAFKVLDKQNFLPGKKVLLVDDVMTTGTTLAECARALKEAGAAKVWALALAKS